MADAPRPHNKNNKKLIPKELSGKILLSRKKNMDTRLEENSQILQKDKIETTRTVTGEVKPGSVQDMSGGIGAGAPTQETRAPEEPTETAKKESQKEDEEREKSEGGEEEKNKKEKQGEENGQDNKEETNKEEPKKESAAEKVKDKIEDKEKSKAEEAALTVATGGWGKVIIFLAKYGKYILIFIAFFLIVLYFAFQSGLFTGSGKNDPMDAKKNSREIKKIKSAVAQQGASDVNRLNNTAQFLTENKQAMGTNIQALKDKITNNYTGSDKDALSKKLDDILNLYLDEGLWKDIEELRKLEAIPETELKLTDPDQRARRKELRDSVDEKFSKMFGLIREIQTTLQVS